MTPAYVPGLVNHLWQSTLFSIVMALLAFVFRRNRAQFRYALWLSASLKFLVPFSPMIALGGHLHFRTAPPISLPVAAAVASFGLPVEPPFFTGTLAPPSSPYASTLSTLLLGVWLIGAGFVLGRWILRWVRLSMAASGASPWILHASVPVMRCRTLVEPGVFGIFRPAILFPEGIEQRLTADEVRAVLAHELCHVRRRDNLAAATHMLVEAIFWFYPPVRWVGARLLEERERACDEEVLSNGSQPEVYAGSILNVCRFYVESPLPCASGVTGAGLEKRIEAIMTNRVLSNLTVGRRLLLASAAIAIVAATLTVGLVNARRVHAQDDGELKFDVATIKLAKGGGGKAGLDFPAGGGLQFASITLRQLVTFAYDVPDYQVSGGPGWMNSESYNIVAKPEHPEGPGDVSHLTPMQQRTQWDRARARTRALLAERFQLVTHQETKEGTVYALVVAKGGPKLQESKDEGNPSTMRNQTEINARRGTMEMLAFLLSNWLRRPFVDRTGLPGHYDYKLTYGQEPAGSAGGGPPGASLSDADPANASGPSIYTALQEQLGLKIESQKGPVKVIVIDRVEKPSAN